MHLIQHLLFYVISVHGFSLRDPSLLYNCLSSCLNDACVNACNDFTDESIYPQITEDTLANVSLHCSGQNVIMIKFNPGIYIIEQSLSDSAWNFAKVTKGNIAKFTNLTAGSRYRYRFYNFTKEGISRPELSDWFFTYEANYEPLSVKSIKILSQQADETEKCNLRAEIAFEPAEDRSCNYNVVIWDGKLDVRNRNLEQMSQFRFVLKDLNFDNIYNVSISSVNRYGIRTSPMESMTFCSPSCLEYYKNLTMCVPESVEGLRSEYTNRNGNLYDLKVYWDEPLLEPDNYTLKIDLHGDEEEVYIWSISGNRTEIFIPNIKLGPQYIVSIVADSLGGSSVPVTIFENLATNQTSAINESYREVIIGIALSVTIVVLAGMSCLQYWKHKSKELSMECTRVESFNEKGESVENTKKLLLQNYDLESNNSVSLTLAHDKFELCPKLLKIGVVLGSGAYGVVRLGSLQDKFDNVKDVAVKMLKDNPSKEDVQNFHKEILIMKFVGQHPNVVSLTGCCNLYNKPVLVVEYCCKGDLQKYLRTIWQSMVNVAFNHRARLKIDADSFDVSGTKYHCSNSGGDKQSPQNTHVIANRLYDIQQDMSQYTEIVTANDLLNFSRQIATGMEFLSSNRIVHRDLAARNILVCADGIVKISDFGLSRDVYQENLYRKEGNSKLPLKWMAIEALTHQIYTTQSDVWSFGILLWEIVTMGAIPYLAIPADALLKLLKSGYRMERPVSCSTELYNIMFSCWNVRPQSRPTFTQLRESLDKLLSYQSDNKYLNMDEILCESEEQYQESEK